MEQGKKLSRYPVQEINPYLETLRKEYDLVRLVDVDECRILEVLPDGNTQYQQECFHIWSRAGRCENCTSFQACRTHCAMDKSEYLGEDRLAIHSVPLELVLLNGEIQSCVVECVRSSGKDAAGAKAAAEREGELERGRDALTRLYTADRLYQEIRRKLTAHPQERYLLVMGNIRNFKLLNQLFGLEGGNRLLVGLGNLLREICGDEAVYGRYRDDRFLLLTPQAGFDGQRFAEQARERAKAVIESPIFDVCVKLGVYEIADENLPVTVMAEHAELAVNSIRDDRALSLAYFAPEMLERKLRDQRILMDFGPALEKGEFQIYLQPQVRSDGELLGAEALVRWVRPDKVLPPTDFLPVLAHSELLSHLDTRVWEQAAALLKKWQGTPLEKLSLSVNVDPRDFFYLDVPEFLSGLCAKYSVPPHALRIEITETALVEDIERKNRMVERLQAAGFLVEIDDFGKGASSLSCLKDIRADVLKIDMGFLQGRRNTDRSRIILAAVVKMAQRLHMDVITEGVETKEQVELLTGIGCNAFQGFFFSHPLPVREFEAVARARL